MHATRRRRAAARRARAAAGLRRARLGLGRAPLHHRPDQRAQQHRQQAEHHPARCRAPLRLHHQAGRQAGERNAHARAAENQPAHGRAPQYREAHHGPGGGIQQHKGAGHAGGKAQGGPAVRQWQGHGQRQQHRGHQAGARQPRRVPALVQGGQQPGQGHAGQRAHQVAHIVGGGQPAALGQRDHAVVQHHGQQRREGKAPHAHGHGQRQHAGQGHGGGAVRPVARGGRGRRVRGWMASMVMRWRWGSGGLLPWPRGYPAAAIVRLFRLLPLHVHEPRPACPPGAIASHHPGPHDGLRHAAAGRRRIRRRRAGLSGLRHALTRRHAGGGSRRARRHRQALWHEPVRAGHPPPRRRRGEPPPWPGWRRCTRASACNPSRPRAGARTSPCNSRR